MPESEYYYRAENEELRKIIVKLELELSKKEKELKNEVEFSNYLRKKNAELEEKKGDDTK